MIFFPNLATMTKKGSPIVPRDGGLRFAGWKINLPATTFNPPPARPPFSRRKRITKNWRKPIFNSFLSDSY